MHSASLIFLSQQKLIASSSFELQKKKMQRGQSSKTNRNMQLVMYGFKFYQKDTVGKTSMEEKQVWKTF